MQTQTLIAILMGSGSDWPVVKEAADTLARFGVPMEVHVLSAHRTPDAAAEFSRTAVARGLKVLIAAAGGAAHLAGVLAAHTTLPVIGIPMQSALNGLDSLLSTVQMPAGIPVATVAIGKPGAANAALLAVQILALNDEVLQRGLQQHKETIKQKAAEADAQIQAEWLAASDLTPQQKFT